MLRIGCGFAPGDRQWMCWLALAMRDC